MNTKVKILAISQLIFAIFLTASAQNTGFTYQGRVLDNGTNFNGAGQFKFAIVTSTNTTRAATATASVTSGFVTSYTVTFGGAGYSSPPSVTVTGGGGSGATATAAINGGVVTSIAAGNAGSGYTSAPTVVVAPPPPNLSYTTFWSNDGTSANGSEPAAAVLVNVSNGLFIVALGDTTLPNMSPPHSSMFSQPNLQLRIWFNDGANGFTALSPVQDLTPTPYSIAATMLTGGFKVQSNTNGAPNIVGGSPVNSISDGAVGATIAGGGATYYYGATYTNRVIGDFGTVGGGAANVAGWYATVGGGSRNVATNYAATVGGGSGNVASGLNSTVSGGSANTAAGADATVPGGALNSAAGAYSFAAGYNAQAVHNNTFVWSGSTFGSVSSGTPGQFLVFAPGGIQLSGGNVQTRDLLIGNGGGDYRYVQLGGGNSSGYFYGSYPYFGDGIHMSYNFYADGSGTPHLVNPGGGSSRVTTAYSEVVLAVGNAGFGPNLVRLDATLSGVTVNGTFNNNSDLNAKERFEPVAALQILQKVSRLPITKWSYKEDPGTRHIGPVAQDFHAAFNVGTDDRHIAPIDEGGVALAAIQALNYKLDEQRAQNVELKRELADLKKLVQSLKGLH